MKNLFTITTSVAISVFITLFVLGSAFQGGTGASLTNLTGTDQLTDFPTTYNANLTEINNSKFELSDWYATTTAPQITTLANLATVGTIGTGTWQADAIAEIYGGTGQSTYSPGDLLYADASNSLAKLATSTADRVLTIDSTTGFPVWQSGTVDEGLNYDWTGIHNFTGTDVFVETFNASSTSANPISFNGLSYSFPSNRSASSTVLSEDGSGNVSFNSLQSLGASSFLGATTTDTTVADITTETEYGSGAFATIPANLMGANGAVRVEVSVSALSDSGNNDNILLDLEFGGTDVCTLRSDADAPAASVKGVVTFFIYNDDSTSSQRCISTLMLGDFTTVQENTSAVNTTSSQDIKLQIQWESVDGGETETITVSNARAEFVGR